MGLTELRSNSQMPLLVPSLGAPVPWKLVTAELVRRVSLGWWDMEVGMAAPPVPPPTEKAGCAHPDWVAMTLVSMVLGIHSPPILPRRRD